MSEVAHVGTPLIWYSSNPTQTAAAAADTLVKFGSDGKATANHIKMQNNTAANVYYAYDQDSTASGKMIYVLAAGQTLFEDRSFLVLHVSSAAQQSFGGQSGISIEVFA